MSVEVSTSVISPNALDDRAAMGLDRGFVARPLTDAVADHRTLRGIAPAELVGIVEDQQTSLALAHAAATRLAVEGDPRLDVLDPPMVSVEAGTFSMGTALDEVSAVVRQWEHLGVSHSWIEKEAPAHAVHVARFRIGRFPVTNLEYRAFLEATGDARLPSSWTFGAYPAHAANHPVHGVAPDDADAYAAWLSIETGRRFRLPTEAEWELASSGGDGREFPWGDVFDPNRLNSVEAGPLGTTPVGVYRDGAAACGALDMAGNVEEWVADEYRPYPGGRIIRDELYLLDPAYRIARGGSFSRFGDLARCRRRHGPYPRQLYAMGFRLAESVPPNGRSS